MLSIRRVPHGHPDASRLWQEMGREISQRYGNDASDFHLEPDGIVALLVGYVGDEPVATGAVRFRAYGSAPPVAELKRLFVQPGHRRKGFSRVLMGAMEEVARGAGATRIILETGTEQPEAVALYRAIGYGDIPPYGEFSHDPRSLCFAKELPTRVLVVSGTMGAGKSAVASAVGALLGARGARFAWIDGDDLCQAGPENPSDPYNQGLLFDALAGVAPAYRKRGLGIIVCARVVEDPDDRARYATAFRSDGGLAEVTIARVTAPEASLDALDLEDLVVDSAGRAAAETAGAILDGIGWGEATF